jgi:ribosomal protein S12 methylthiotransferase
MKTLAICNLGCSKNIIDGELITAYLCACNFKIINTYEEADIIVVNTCTFIQEATEEAIQAVLEMAQYKQTGACSTLVAAGCFSERYRERVKQQFPEVDLWLSVAGWPKELNRYFKLKGTVSSKRVLLSKSATQYLKVSDGCSHRCTFCIIPSIRGKFKSRSINTILQEARWLYEQGVKECIIVSQDTSFYGRDMGYSLQKLLETLLKNTGFHWIRMMYLHPHYVDDSFLKFVASEKRICSYFDIPLQHIAEPVLKKMRRTPSSPKKLYQLIEHTRSLVPDATIRTSFILGFPGENNSHFQQLVRFVEWARFEKVGVFPFSPEEGTKAFTMKPRPHTSTALKRCEILMDVQREISREICESKIGSKKEVIIDRVSNNPDFIFEARTEGDAPEIDGRVFVVNGNSRPGKFETVHIIDANDFDLFGEIL